MVDGYANHGSRVACKLVCAGPVFGRPNFQFGVPGAGYNCSLVIPENVLYRTVVCSERYIPRAYREQGQCEFKKALRREVRTL
jgi:hypothetical protein